MSDTGKTCQTDRMDPARASALLRALSFEQQIGTNDSLPPFFHQLYFWEARPPSDLGRDGHPATGGLIPDTGLPRRMWAGGRLSFHAPLRAGVAAFRQSCVENTAHKTGRSGPLGFVTLRHEIHQEGQLCVSEWQDLVYRNDPQPGIAPPPPPQAPIDEEVKQEARFDTTLLFRYSALTFNGHKIHYDLDYAREVEGYRGLVVHGPLLAQMLMLMAAKRAPLEYFSFRATSPLMHFETATLCQKGDALWVRGPDGRLCMTASTKSPISG